MLIVAFSFLFSSEERIFFISIVFSKNSLQRKGESMNKKRNTLFLVLTAMFTALTTVVTMFVQIPNPATGGYVNIGDCIVLASATLLGPTAGFVVGGLGSCFADLLSGYAHWALPTFLIKGIEGFLCGITTYYIFRTKASKGIKLLSVALVSFASSIIMMLGYYLANYAMGGVGKAVASVVPNTIQAAVSFAIDIVFISALIKTKVFNGYLSISISDNLVKSRKKKKENNSQTSINTNTSESDKLAYNTAENINSNIPTDSIAITNSETVSENVNCDDTIANKIDTTTSNN